MLVCIVGVSGNADEQTEVLPAEEAARTMIVPEGFRVTLVCRGTRRSAADWLLH
jgi:hypothetical protein